MASTALAVSLFLAANAGAPSPTDAAEARPTTNESAAESLPVVPASSRRRSPALFGGGIAVGSVGALGIAVGVGLLIASESNYAYVDDGGSYSTQRSDYKTPAIALLVAGPIVTAGGIVMAIVGGHRDGPPPVPADEIGTRRQSPGLFGTGIGLTIAGSLAMWSGLGLLSLSSLDEAPRWAGPLALGGALVTGAGLTMAIVGGKRVHADEVMVVPIVDSKTAGAAAVVRF